MTFATWPVWLTLCRDEFRLGIWGRAVAAGHDPIVVGLEIGLLCSKPPQCLEPE